MIRKPFIGLFGTCGNSTWRETFIERYRDLGINYFNPQVSDWKPEHADIEAQHLKTDEIILFPVTRETYGTGSLAETGFSILQATQNTGRYIIVMIDPDLDDALKADETAYRESIRARRLVRAHLAANPHPHVFVVHDLEEMFELSVQLHSVAWGILDIRARYTA